jgi:hypothetical protein
MFNDETIREKIILLSRPVRNYCWKRNMETPSLDAASDGRPAGNFGSDVGPFRSALVNIRRVIAKLRKSRVMFTLSSLYCLAHWVMVTHSFSIYVLLSALARLPVFSGQSCSGSMG